MHPIAAAIFLSIISLGTYIGYTLSWPWQLGAFITLLFLYSSAEDWIGELIMGVLFYGILIGLLVGNILYSFYPPTIKEVVEVRKVKSKMVKTVKKTDDFDLLKFLKSKPLGE